MLKYSNILKLLLGRQSEKNPKKKGLNRKILSTDISTLPLYLHQVAHIDCSAPSGKQHEPPTGVCVIGSHLTREPTLSPVLNKCGNWELMLSTKFGSLCPKVTNFGSQNFGYQIWLCTRLGIVVACVCVCVCINHLLVRTIIRHLFKLGSPNLVQRSKTRWLRSLLFWGGAIDLDLQGQI